MHWSARPIRLTRNRSKHRWHIVIWKVPVHWKQHYWWLMTELVHLSRLLLVHRKVNLKIIGNSAHLCGTCPGQARRQNVASFCEQKLIFYTMQYSNAIRTIVKLLLSFAQKSQPTVYAWLDSVERKWNESITSSSGAFGFSGECISADKWRGRRSQ